MAGSLAHSYFSQNRMVINIYTNAIVPTRMDSNWLYVCFKTKFEIQHTNPDKIPFPVALSAIPGSVWVFFSLFDFFDPVQISFYILSERGTDKKSPYTRALRMLSSVWCALAVGRGCSAANAPPNCLSHSFYGLATVH